MQRLERVCKVCQGLYPPGGYYLHKRTPTHVEAYLRPGRRAERRALGHFDRITRHERNDAIVAAVKSGRPIRDVAAEYGLTFQRVSQIARREGVGHEPRAYRCFICDTGYRKWADHVATTAHDANAAELVRRLEHLSQGQPDV